MTDEQAVNDLIDEMGRISENWGFSPALGEVWTILYLKGDMTQEQLKKELNSCLSSISQSLKILENCGVISRTRKEGRKKVYRAEFSLPKIRKRIFENALKMKIEPLIPFLEQKSKQIKSKELKKKVTDLKDYCSKSEKIIKMILKIPLLTK